MYQCKYCGRKYLLYDKYYWHEKECIRLTNFIGIKPENLKENININFETIPELESIPKNEFEKAIVDVCNELAQILIRKNRDYGDSYRKMKEEFGDTALIIRESDKLERLKTLQKQGNLVEESIKDTKLDGAGYYILDLACERVMK